MKLPQEIREDENDIDEGQDDEDGHGRFRHVCQVAIARFLESYVFDPSGLWTMALKCNAAKFDSSFPWIAPHALAQSKERKGSNFAIWQP